MEALSSCETIAKKSKSLSLVPATHCTPLGVACFAGMANIVELLLARGADEEGEGEMSNYLAIPPLCLICYNLDAAGGREDLRV